MKVFFFAMLYFTILEIRDATIEFTSQRLARGPHRNSKLYEKLKRQNGVLILASPLDDNINLEEAANTEQPLNLEYQQQIPYQTRSRRTIGG